MQTITFTCETITPMFLAGADGTPELRAPSIKGALRFWWRAINGHLSLKDMREAEGEIFGDTTKRSNVIIIVREQPRKENIEPNALLPHKNNSARPDSYKIKTTLTIEFKLVKTVKINIAESFDLESLRKLFTSVCVLGGFGKRSRRGFGSVTITHMKKEREEFKPYVMPQTLSEIKLLLGSKFEMNSSTLLKSNFGRKEGYPFIESIEIGVADREITTKIINASHEVKDVEYRRAEKYAKDNDDYREFFNKKTGQKESKLNVVSNFESAIGSGTPRCASPIYVSVLGDKPIITTLNHVPPRGVSRKEHLDLQTQFKDKLK
jgi:CRISPR-associated protein Cmr1